MLWAEELKQLHDTDLNLWIEQMAIAVKNRDTKNMDWDNLLEEIEDMGASQKRALRSYYFRLVEHILKLRDWEAEKARNETKWRVEIINFRRAINNILEDSPSLKNYLLDNYDDWYDKVIEDYSKSNLFAIAKGEPLSLTQIMQQDFFG